jgi:hypothetical protein
MKAILSPIARRIGTLSGGLLLGVGMTESDASLAVAGITAVALFAMDLALSRFNFLRF